MLVAPHVSHLHLLDASTAALDVARENLKSMANVSFHARSVADIPLPANSLDFAYSLGVLHHVPDKRLRLRPLPENSSPARRF